MFVEDNGSVVKVPTGLSVPVRISSKVGSWEYLSGDDGRGSGCCRTTLSGFDGRLGPR